MKSDWWSVSVLVDLQLKLFSEYHFKAWILHSVALINNLKTTSSDLKKRHWKVNTEYCSCGEGVDVASPWYVVCGEQCMTSHYHCDRKTLATTGNISHGWVP